jgi:uncharacterized protein YggE
MSKEIWRIRAATSDTQKLIDIAVQAGANGVEDVRWDVADTKALEAKAHGAAFDKARTRAAETAKSAGGKLGDLLYINVVSGIGGGLLARGATTSEMSASRGHGFPTPAFSLQLFPEKVEQQATVRAAFALD